jgi:hypothetical protein
VYFLKQLSDARAIRQRLVECFEQASAPFATAQEQARLLSFVVVGGELHTFLLILRVWQNTINYSPSIALAVCYK